MACGVASSPLVDQAKRGEQRANHKTSKNTLFPYEIRFWGCYFCMVVVHEDAKKLRGRQVFPKEGEGRL